jgi:hypothetical protein
LFYLFFEIWITEKAKKFVERDGVNLTDA